VLKKLGVLKKGHLVEVQRSDLVAGAIGQTALKTRDKINEGLIFFKKINKIKIR
jgi:stage V sporulation protein K